MSEQTAVAPGGRRPPALRVEGLTKTFGRNTALHDLSTSIATGTVKALVGHNGSGKSTLIKCLAGVYTPDRGGAVEVNGIRLPHGYPPSHAHRYGLTFVHQDLGLIEGLSVTENVALGLGYERRGGAIDWRATRAAARAVVEASGLDISVSAPVRDLTPTQRTLLAIGRAVRSTRQSDEPGCLVLDEPTAALPAGETGRVLEQIGRLAAAGWAILYVSHRLGEVLTVSDEVIVIRDGRAVWETPTDHLTESDLLDALVLADERQIAEQTGHGGDGGRDLAPAGLTAVVLDEPAPDPPRRAHPAGIASSEAGPPAALQVVDLSGPRVREVSFEIRAGETVGVAGLAGAGRSELARLITGAQVASGGTVTVHGQHAPNGTPRTPAEALRLGVTLVPEDRLGSGCIQAMSVGDNLTLASLGKWSRGGLLRVRGERRAAAALKREVGIHSCDLTTPAGNLSGGNQQKIVLGKCLATGSRIIVLDEPFQGVDALARAEIVELIRARAAEGLAVLVIDSEIEALCEISDRVLLLRDGELAREFATSWSVTDVKRAVLSTGAPTPRPQEAIA